MLMRLAPALFVFLWSTGFIAVKLGIGDCEPFTFLTLRFAAVIALLGMLGWAVGSPRLTWPQRRDSAIVGLGVHGLYLSGVFWAVRHGMPAGVVALIVSLQPIVTSVLAGLVLGERAGGREWAGLVLGIAGSALLLAPKIEVSVAAGGGTGINAATIGAALVALGGITFGTIYQKRAAGSIDLVGGAIWQYLGALTLALPMSLLLETRQVTWSPEFALALGWLVIVLSIGAISLLMLLIRSSAVSRVSSLFYLVPATTALMAYLMFGERLLPIQLAGMVLAMAAVALIAYPKGKPVE